MIYFYKFGIGLTNQKGEFFVSFVQSEILPEMQCYKPSFKKNHFFT